MKQGAAAAARVPGDWELKRQIAGEMESVHRARIFHELETAVDQLRSIYGVDLNPMAVELAKLALWLDAFVPGLPLSYLDHNLRLDDPHPAVREFPDCMGAKPLGHLGDFGVG